MIGNVDLVDEGVLVAIVAITADAMLVKARRGVHRASSLLSSVEDLAVVVALLHLRHLSRVDVPFRCSIVASVMIKAVHEFTMNGEEGRSLVLV